MKPEMWMSERDLEVLQGVLEGKALQHGRKIAIGCKNIPEDTGYSGTIMIWVRDTLEKLGFDVTLKDEEQDPLLLAGIDYDAIRLAMVRGMECVMAVERQ